MVDIFQQKQNLIAAQQQSQPPKSSPAPAPAKPSPPGLRPTPSPLYPSTPSFGSFPTAPSTSSPAPSSSGGGSSTIVKPETPIPSSALISGKDNQLLGINLGDRTLPVQRMTTSQLGSLQRAGLINVNWPNEIAALDALNLQTRAKLIRQQAMEAMANAPKVDVSTPFARFLLKVDKSMGFSNVPPTYAELVQQYKNSPLGYVFSVPKLISSGVSGVLQKTGLSAGESKAVGETTGTTSLFAIFSPLFSSMMAKKGTKTVTVEKKETAVKAVSKEAAKNKILSNAITNPQANRDIVKDILEKAREANSPALVKQYQRLFEEAIGKEAAQNLFKDVAEQEMIYVRPIQKQQFQIFKPTTALKPTTEFLPETLRQAPTEYRLSILYPSIVQIGGIKQSQYQNQGLAFNTISILKTFPMQTIGQTFKITDVSATKSLNASATASALIQPSIQVQPQIQIPKQIIKSIQPQIEIPKIEFPLTNLFPKLAGSIKLISKEEKRRIKFKTLFQTMLKRKGRYNPIGFPSARGKAIKAGETAALATLARSFKIIPTRKQTTELTLVPENYAPSSKLFRGYKIRKGKIIPLKDEWIQKVGIVTKSEVSEIIGARKRKAIAKGRGLFSRFKLFK